MDDLEMSEIEKSIREGQVEEVKRLIKSVNQNIEHTNDEHGSTSHERSLLVSLRNIKSENDEWFHISRLLLEQKNVDVNTECGRVSEYNKTILGLLCDT